ncbi:MAG: ankyrin repeat domain-containing protein [Planctomycetota bacterium]|jgi:ankyrin repeat protein
MKKTVFVMILLVHLLCGCDSHNGILTKRNLYDLRTVKATVEELTDEQERRNFKAHVLSRASESGDVDIVRYIVSQGPVDVSSPYVRGGPTPLHYAIRHDNMAIFMILLEDGADVNKETRRYVTPLMWAVRAEKLQHVNLLLANGADINKVSNDVTALHIATSIGSASMVEFLLDNGADVNIDSGSGCRPIHVAAWRDRVEISRILLEHGADPRLECDGRTAFEIARSQEFRKLLQQHDAAQKS